METAIFDPIEKGLIKDINESPFFAVMLDETCDITIEKKLVIYRRYLKKGKVLVAFLGNQGRACVYAKYAAAYFNF